MDKILFFSFVGCFSFLCSCSYMTLPEIANSLHMAEVVETAIEKEVEDAIDQRCESKD